MSGTYDLRRFYDAKDFSDDFWVSSPIHFVPTLEGRHLDVLKTRYILLPSGEGRAEDLGESWRMGNALGAKGIPNRVDPWGTDWHHDWPTWREMLPKYLGEWTK
jgi:esterase/lipase superfamily enzyme